MFEHILLETAGGSKWKKGLSIVVSTLAQCLLICAMVVSPLLFTEGVPRVAKLVGTYLPPAPPPPPPPPGDARPAHPSNQTQGGMAVSRPRIEGERPDFTRISTGIPPEEGNVGFLDPPVITGVGVTGGQGPSNGMLNGLLRNESYRPPPPPPVVKHEPDRPVPITNIESARILNRPQPVYPAIARQTRTQGTVRLEAIISREGYIENLRIIDGHPLLVQAALDAVKQWRYKPTLLNGQAVEVITTIEVHFMLSQ